MKQKLAELKTKFITNLDVNTENKIIDNVLKYANLTRNDKVYRWIEYERLINEDNQTFVQGVPSPMAKIENLYNLTIDKLVLTRLGKNIFLNIEAPDNNDNIQFLDKIGVEALFKIPDIESKYERKGGLNVSNIITSDYKSDDYNTLISIQIQDLLNIEGVKIYKDSGSFFANIGIDHKPIFFLLSNLETKVKCEVIYMEISKN